MSFKLQDQKLSQAQKHLSDSNVDVWLTFSREGRDPIMRTIVGLSEVGETAVLVTPRKRIIIGASYDTKNFKSTGNFDKVISYKQGVEADLKKEVGKIKPKRIAINYSESSHVADGLCLGMYKKLSKILGAKKFVSAEPVIKALRSQKTNEELRRIKDSVKITEKIFDDVTEFLKPGITELDVSDHVFELMKNYDARPAWNPPCPIVYTGINTTDPHHAPSKTKIKKGDLVGMDFGVRLNKDSLGYCSDIQRTWYVLKKGESKASQRILKLFNHGLEAIELSFKNARPGRTGFEVDSVVRKFVTSKGYPDYKHSTAHGIGTETHDVETLIGPLWPRYGERVKGKIEAGNVYAIEPSVKILGVGGIHLEENIYIGKKSNTFLSHPQKELMYIK